jgi:hypothetical protein
VPQWHAGAPNFPHGGAPKMRPAPLAQTAGTWLDQAFAILTAWEDTHGGPMLQRTTTIALAERIARALEQAFELGRWERIAATGSSRSMAAKFKPGDDVVLSDRGDGRVWRVVRVLEDLGAREAGYLLSDGRSEQTATEGALLMRLQARR